MSAKKTVGSRKFVILAQNALEGGYAGQCLKLPGAISEEESLEELKTNITKATQPVFDILEEQAKKDERITMELPN